MSEAAVPALRFPELGGAWKKATLGDLCDKPKYGMNAAAVAFDGRAKYIRITDIDEQSRAFTPNPLTSPDCGYDPSYKLKVGDIVFARTGASTGKSYIYVETDGELYFAGFLIRFHVKYAVPAFVYAQTLRRDYRKWVGIFSMRSGQPGINAEEYSTFGFSTPTLPEQQKIADFLGAVDARVGLLRRRRDALRAYKKGMMQRLFSQELRFTKPDGSPFPDWQEKRLGDFCDCLSGYPVPGDQISETPTNCVLLRGVNITEGRIRHSNEMDRFLGCDFSGLERFLLENGDVVIGMDGSKVGKNVAIISGDDVGSFLIQRVARLRSDGINSLNFVYHHIVADSFRKYVDIVNTSSGIPHISLKQIRDFPISMPHPEEQQKIADTLTALDAKIDAVTAQIDAMLRFKKGLLQQMFV